MYRNLDQNVSLSSKTPLAFSLFFLLGSPGLCGAQPIPDTTLGVEQSQVQRFGNIDFITGGATRGENLFHSFEQFSIAAGEGAYFDNPAGITAILSRVTGTNLSAIEGGLGVLGEADLFLLNPNGVLFGPDAVLDIPGSLVVSTAEQLRFSDGAEFSAMAPENIPLLTISRPLPLSTEVPATGIIGVNGSDLFVGEDITFVANQVGFLDGGSLYVSGAGGGNIAIQAQALSLLEGSALLAGIESGVEAGEAVAGDITIQATGDVLVEEGSAIVNSVGVPFVPVEFIEQGFVELAQGQAGNINIQGQNLTVRDGALVATSTSGRGNAGSINLDIHDDIFLANLDPGQGQGLGSLVNLGGEGDAGDLIIGTQRFTLDQAQIGAITAGKGNAGDVSLIASDFIVITGLANSDPLNGRAGIFATVEESAMGQGGDIQIQTDVLQILDGGIVDNSIVGIGNAGAIEIDTRILNIAQGGSIANVTLSKGNAGPIRINAQHISLDGNSPELGRSAIFSTVDPGATGNGGAIEVNAETLRITNGAEINSGSFAIDQEGDSPIPTQGNGGAIKLNVRDSIELEQGVIRSEIGTATIGNAGRIEITTGRLRLKERSLIDSGIDGQGNSAPIVINAQEFIEIDGEETGIANQVLSNAVGDSLGIDITTPRLRLTNGGRISTATGGNGDAGPIRIETTELNLNQSVLDSLTTGPGAPGEIILLSSEAINLENSLIISSIGEGAQVDSSKPPGSITLQTSELSLSSDSSIQAQVSPNAEAPIAGQINVLADSIQLDDGSEIQTRAASQDGGSLDLRATTSLLLRNGSTLSTSAGTAQAGGNGGNIRLNAPFIIAVPDENSDITANAFTGDGGNINITAQSVLGLAFRAAASTQSDITASSELGLNGTVVFNTPDIDPSSGLAELPGTPSAPNQVDRTCAGEVTTANRFVITGRGGIPSSPQDFPEAQQAAPAWIALPSRDAAQEPMPEIPSASRSTSSDSSPIYEASSWIEKEDGQITLLSAALPRVTQTPCLVISPPSNSRRS